MVGPSQLRYSASANALHLSADKPSAYFQLNFVLNCKTTPFQALGKLISKIPAEPVCQSKRCLLFMGHQRYSYNWLHSITLRQQVK